MSIIENIDCFVALDDCSPTVQEYIGQSTQVPGQEDAFYVVDIDDILNKHRNWIQSLPRVRPYYAVKCNSSRVILEILMGLGIGFDCASKGEIQELISLGALPKDIIYANPCKPKSHIEYAAKTGVKLMTFDNTEELYKVARYMPDAQLVLRIRVPDEHAVCVLGTKYGAEMDDVTNLLTLAKKLNLNVTGVSFHVGSGCTSAEAYSIALQNARFVFDVAIELGFQMNLLDIGGGFPGSSDSPITFDEVAKVINANLDLYFPTDQDISIIAEPGRYYVASAFTLACNIVAKKVIKNSDGSPNAMYYLNDGVYGSFNCTIFDHYETKPTTLDAYRSGTDEQGLLSTDQTQFQTTIWGPTCDSMDCIKKDFYFPEMQVGEWIIFPDMGAYTICAASNFNGFKTPSLKFYVKSYGFELISQFYNWAKIANKLNIRPSGINLNAKNFRGGSLPLNMIEVN
ncbi:ornithine decarboxylase isoform X1 [Tetranychus urticae]|uniref:ornithine decarboxylase n=1 Tax=Tetranychus urticae TaxID=32264 RepID=T1KEY0_TETUR|nr:ornithine decarboxylase isoform X1 [Tetranychus urticae]XP_015786454.1 ornithine decarboxylase isoform X1 [Tetranychus urticae]